jgi:SlyX protein
MSWFNGTPGAGPIRRKREAIMSEERLVDIETKLAHQEQLVLELNDVVTEQQQKIMKLEELFASLVEKFRSMGDGASAEEVQDERPPHY